MTDPTAPGAGEPPATSPAVLLVALGREVESRLGAALEPSGLSLRLMGALGHLARQPGLSYTELARRARVTPQSMHATVAALIEAGAVAPAGPGRGKRALLEVTDQGHRLLAAGQAAITAVDVELRSLAALPPDGDLFRMTIELSRRPPPAP
ncbi:MarR family winged helix-turn-helix transcriptional regulator [Modestobacter sp. VKM Ac-2983]|uniref:MarR family winged helix-turn-helix transcriptional regulator n=1 Tax=Modestobacter sp. VKM Ac-2983 TaxID=3004137 RepID=UPI0022AB7D95|nr:MarR family winged helix-turn-helix transcriptional regulator [Modestobacter sp. VKM Ac-2983]MCZ2805988.1 MarR family winged helix-turn-helix transcriptional regulator [Modestobacter sp. VKM Ac-2983]